MASRSTSQACAGDLPASDNSVADIWLQVDAAVCTQTICPLNHPVTVRCCLQQLHADLSKLSRPLALLLQPVHPLWRSLSRAPG